MDGKKKRNKKKKGNQAKTADDAISNAEEAVPQDQNHEPASQNHNHNGVNAANADVQSVGVSESDAEVDKHKLYEAKFVNLQETIKQLEDEKNSWLQKVTSLEGELQNLQNKVGSRVKNEALLEEKLNNLLCGYEALVEKEVILGDKVKVIEGIKGSLIQYETSINEAITELVDANKALQAQVKVLEESSNCAVEENQRLTKRFHELESRIQVLETKVIVNETSSAKELVEERKVMEQMQLTDPPLHQQNTAFSEGNELHIEVNRSTNAEIFPNDDGSNLGRNVSPCNHVKESDERISESSQRILPSMQFPEKIDSNHVTQDIVDVNAQPGLKPEIDEPRISEEIMAVPLDEIQIHEEEPPGVSNNGAMEDVPLSDAPLIGAPFRLFSFVAKYVSGADLVHQNSSTFGHQAA